MKKLLTSTMATLLFAVLAITSLHAADKEWLTGTVLESGFTNGVYAGRVATVTVEFLDPYNSNPNMRKQILIITTGTSGSTRSAVDLSVGATFKAYRVKYSDGYGSLMLRYEDKNGREKQEIHQIANELPSR
jgi:hypothetical protein